MLKITSALPATAKSLTLAARSIARMEAAAAQVHAEANGGRGFQAVSSKEGFSAVIKHGARSLKSAATTLPCGKAIEGRPASDGCTSEAGLRIPLDTTEGNTQ